MSLAVGKVSDLSNFPVVSEAGGPLVVATLDIRSVVITKLIFRFIGFLACCAGGMACFGIAFLFLPIRKSHLPRL
jgi:hypothetical protein